jgi:hypothetical protein
MGFRLFYVDGSGNKYDFSGSEVLRTVNSNAEVLANIDLSGQSATLPSGAKLGLRIYQTTSYEMRIFGGYDVECGSSRGPSGILQVNYDSTGTPTTTTTTTTTATSTTSTTSPVTTTTTVAVTLVGSPINSDNTDASSGLDGYYQIDFNWDGRGYNWLEDGQVYHFRIEYLRPTAPDAGNSYQYQIKAWIFSETETASWSAAKLNLFSDVREIIFDDPAGDASLHIGNPQITKTIKTSNSLQLDPGYHADMERILFGFTQGTGGRSQHITVRGFQLYFLKHYPAGYPDNW